MNLLRSLVIALVFIFNEHPIFSDARLITDKWTVSEMNNPKTKLSRNIPRPEEIAALIQIMDPYEFDRSEFNLLGEIINLKVNVTKGSISGLSNFEFLDLNISTVEPSVRFSILFPHLKFYAAHYELDGNIYYIVPLRGDGVADLEIIGLQMWGTLYLRESSTNNGLLLDKLENTALKVEQIVSKIDFDHNIDDIINALVGDLVADYLNRFNKLLIASYSDDIVKYINSLLHELE